MYCCNYFNISFLLLWLQCVVFVVASQISFHIRHLIYMKSLLWVVHIYAKKNSTIMPQTWYKSHPYYQKTTSESSTVLTAMSENNIY